MRRYGNVAGRAATRAVIAAGATLVACTAAPPTDLPSAPAPMSPTTAPAAQAEGDAPTSAPTPAAPYEPPPRERWPEGYLGFDHACEPGPVVTIAAVGDLLLHRELQKQAFAAPQRYRALWSGVEDLLGRTDLTYANLEGPTAPGITRGRELVADPGLRFDNKVYTGYARFNYHPSLGIDLASAGVDVVSTANNHALDRGPVGIDRTLDALDTAGLRYTGTRRQSTPKAPWHAVTEAGGMRIAWLSCTLHTNYEEDAFGQVLPCFDDPNRVPKLVAKLAADETIDAVIVTPHWGKEYAPLPRPKETALARRLIEAGAVAVIGSHPHVLQPWERVVADDGRQGLVVYSLGNFASHQRDLPRRSSIVLYLGLRRDPEGRVVPAGARYVPLHVRMEGDKEAFFVEAIDRVGGHEDARAHVVQTFGAPNLLAPDADLDLAPHCRPGLVAAP
jgi:poly-gamma-glutamate synthesis protein (capsule biosynthesis protein)